jgi:hypothetical protein|tara:strand:+ start:40 stop:588 length:549 start_codon:yes stop_codon:yes gene_type:complete
MGLRTDIIEAKKKAAVESGGTPLQVNVGDKSYIDLEAKYIEEAIINFLSNSNFRITQLKAPIVLEDLKTPDIGVNVKLDTLLGEYQPILKTLKKIADPLGLGGAIDSLAGEIEKAVKPLLEGGATVPGLDMKKDDGALQATGYVYIGEDPDSQGGFDVSDESGQKEFTTVEFFRDDNEELLG